MSVAGEGATVNSTNLYSWLRGRSPLDIERDRSPSYMSDVLADALKTTTAARFVAASFVGAR